MPFLYNSKNLLNGTGFKGISSYEVSRYYKYFSYKCIDFVIFFNVNIMPGLCFHMNLSDGYCKLYFIKHQTYKSFIELFISICLV